MDFKVKVTKLDNPSGNLRGLGTLWLGNDAFVVNGLAVAESQNGLYVSMPSYRAKEVTDDGKAIYKDFCHPVTKEFREALNKAVLESYESGEAVAYGNAHKDLTYSVKAVDFSKDDSNVMGGASVVFENSFAVEKITIMHGKEGVFVSMPSKLVSVENKETGETKDEFRDVCYAKDADFRKDFHDKILSAYADAMDRRQEKAAANQYYKKDAVSR